MSGDTTIAEYYRRYRPLARPQTDVFFVSKGLIVVFVLITLVACLVTMGIKKTTCETEVSTLGLIVRISVCMWLLLIVFGHKRIALLLIELYQHYASEKTRRKCACMPSCSVYALMVLRKHNIIKALYLIANRLSKCCSPVAFIDYA